MNLDILTTEVKLSHFKHPEKLFDSLKLDWVI